MSDPCKQTAEEQLAEARRCEAAVQRAVRQAVLASAYAGQPVPVSRDGKVVWLSPQEVFDLFASEPAPPSPHHVG